MDMSRAQVRLPPNVQDDASSAGDVMIGHKQAKSKPQFEWKKRDFVDQNSVYDGPHPPVAFKSTTPQKKVVPVMLEDDISCITSNAGSQVHYNIIEEKSIGSKTKAKGVEEIVAEDESAMQMEIDDYYSDLALRSNYHSMNSTKGEVIPIKMKRHRGVQQLDRFKVKHNMKVMSLNTKKNIIHDRNIHTAPA